MTSCLNQSSVNAWTSVFLLFLLTLSNSGCQSGATYDAAALPGEYRVAAATRSKSVNLTRVASNGVDNSLIGIGDLVELTILTGFETQRVNPMAMRVADDGTIRVPLLGTAPCGRDDAG